jgi:hypothetical protein
MGYMRHHAIVVSSWSEDSLRRAHEAACASAGAWCAAGEAELPARTEGDLMPSPSHGSGDPARDYLSHAGAEQVIVWAHAADVSRDGSCYTVAENGLQAWVGYIREVTDWGLVGASLAGSWWWATRWDLIEWAGPRKAFP